MIQFKKIIIHNFGSYHHAELDLQNRGFCLVSGQNNCTKDNAASNGSGKSACFSAICYALTGETVSGAKTGLKNVNVEDSDCWVQLDFVCARDTYSICRTAAPKSDLKISKNDVDLSGKGIRESERKLQELLPELSKDFITSCVILGQGMPNKFSSFSPSGRKDLLEKLTKSDFMIEDLKTRITDRQQKLTVKIREYEDSLLANRTLLNGHTSTLEKLKLAASTQVRPNFDEQIKQQSEVIRQLTAQQAKYEADIAQIESKLEEENRRLFDLTSEKAKVQNEELTAYTASYTKLITDKNQILLEIGALKKEIAVLKATKDTCPTCGQQLPNVHKPDTSGQEAFLQTKQVQLEEVEGKIRGCSAQHTEYLAQIEEAFKNEISILNQAIFENKTCLQSLKGGRDVGVVNLTTKQNAYNKLVYDKQNWDSYVRKQQEEIGTLEIEIARLTNLISITSLAKEDYDQRAAIVKKMDLLTKRDFRGYLLANIISYIDNKVKDYCQTVFGTRELSLEINGNALDITYCKKAFDSLSGGEKQRVDLILQLAIRDLLINYLGLSANILVLDEITDFLDKKSCQAVMQLLEKELNTVESVFVISHRSSELGLAIDSEISVIKNENGISELY
jgi:DNA repair exonuclease SbcCD ATPase subunit